MKNKTFILTKIILKNGEGFGISGIKNRVARIVLLTFLALVVPGIVLMLSLFINNTYNILSPIGQEGVIISWGIAINSVFIFIFGIFYIISSFYFSSDIEVLLPLPLKPRQIVGAKFLAVAVYEYIITAVIFIPIMIIYGVRSGSGTFYYIYGLVVYAFIPVVPLATAAIITMVIMRFINVSKHKDAFKLVAGVLAMVLGLGLNAIIQKFTAGIATGNFKEMLLKGNNSIAFITSGVFPTARWAVSAMLKSHTLAGLLDLLLFALASIAVFFILLYLGEILYFKGVIGIYESGSQRIRGKSTLTNKVYVKHPILWTYTINELRLLFRTPIYFLICVLINFIWPVFLLFPLLTQAIDISLFENIAQVLRNPQHFGIILFGGFSLILFLGGTNGVASTSISREGQQIFVKKYIPVSYKVQITAKVLSALTLGMCGVIVMLVFVLALFKLPVFMGILILVTGWLAILLTALLGILIDLYNPKLNWDSEHKAVKQNLNLVYSIILSVLLAGLNMYAAISLSPGVIEALLLLVAVYGGFNGFMCFLVYKKGVQRFIELEG